MGKEKISRELWAVERLGPPYDDKDWETCDVYFEEQDAKDSIEQDIKSNYGIEGIEDFELIRYRIRRYVPEEK